MNRKTQSSDRARLWSAYWASSSGQQDGCLPGRTPRITQMLRDIWHHVASILPPGSSVLDLGTGNGTVLQSMSERRTDLALIGVDLAQKLPPTPRGTTLHSGVDLAELPFDDAGFAAVTSQFGIEYAALGPALSEVGRVLKPGGKAVFITHRMDSPVLRQNLWRANCLNWALERLAISPSAQQIEQLPAEAIATFGQDSPAWEITEALRRTLIQDGESQVGSLAAVLRQRAELESDRIAALADACRLADEDASWVTAAQSAQLSEVERHDMRGTPTDPPFARIKVFVRA